jgi:hypothetical protein
VFFFTGVEIRGAVAGNDGKMAEARRQLKTETAREKTGSITNQPKKKEASRLWIVRSKKARKDGAEKLHLAADRRVGKHSEELADRLTEQALKGDVPSTRVLVALAERKKPVLAVVKKRLGPTMAQQLAMEPQWKGPEVVRD